MVLDVDRTEIVGFKGAMSPYFGSMSNNDLSGGVKGLIMIYKYPDEREYSSVIFGDNCVKWLCELSFLVDFTLVLQHAIHFVDDTPVNAVTPDGITLPYAKEVGRYYIRNRIKYPDGKEKIPDSDTESDH